MRVRALDENGDIVTSGKSWAYDVEAIAQTVKTRLRLFLGEYFRDISDGMPWFEKMDGTEGILGKGYSLSQVESLIRMRIARTEGVIKLLKFGMDFRQNERYFTVDCTIMTKYGEAEIEFGQSY